MCHRRRQTIAPVSVNLNLSSPGGFMQIGFSSCRRIAQNQSGSAVTEYALLLAVIACSVLFGARLIMTSQQNAYNNLAHVWGVPSNDATGPRPAMANQTAADSSTQQVIAEPGTPIGLQVAALATLLILGAVAAGALVKTRRQGEPQPDRIAVEPTLERSEPERFAKKRQEIYRVLSRNLKDLLTSNVSVGHILSQSPVCVDPSMSREELASLMQKSKFRHLLVCNAKGALLGVISDRDVFTDGTTAADLMTPDPYTISAEDDLRTAITVMLTHTISALPVIEHDKVIGILTVTDLIVMLQCTLQLLDKIHAEVCNGTLLDPELFSVHSEPKKSLREEFAGELTQP
jgi:CBS domain-containing protein/Flp pilus assembly pilin Flp